MSEGQSQLSTIICLDFNHLGCLVSAQIHPSDKFCQPSRLIRHNFISYLEISHELLFTRASGDQGVQRKTATKTVTRKGCYRRRWGRWGSRIKVTVRIRDHLLDPGHMGCDPGVDPGVVGLAAPDAPGDHADDGAVVELSTNLREVSQCPEKVPTLC